LAFSSFLLTLLLVAPQNAARVVAEDFSEELPRIEPVEAADTLEDFQVADGFRIELVASEPLVTSPVAIQWDAKGGLFVCEMRGYSEDRDKGISRITRLTDNDNDGRFDKRTIYADELLWPTAIFPYDGGLFVADAPNIYFLRDEDNDGVADRKQVIFTGFSVSNVQGLMNSFHWGLDNRIHIACGTVGGDVQRVNPDTGEPTGDALKVRGYDLAFDPRTFEFARTSGGAQHGMCFDDWGHKFVSSNSDHLQQVMYENRYVARNRWMSAPSARQSIAADGPQAEVFRISPVEPWRIVRTRLRVAGLVRGPIEGGGRPAGYFTGATGATIYRGDAWPKTESPIAIVGDVGSNLIHRKRLDTEGIEFVGHRMDAESEFVASKDIWFRPAQFECGPDGALSVVDVYREVIEHPKSLPPDIKRHLDLTSGRERGRIYRIVPDEGFEHRPTPDMSAMSTADLVPLLAHPNGWHRDTASRLIYARQDGSVVDDLVAQLKDCPTATGRLHTLAALEGLAALQPDLVIACLSDSHPQVVRHAIRLAETYADHPEVIAALRGLIEHPSIHVRYQLGFTVGELAVEDRAEWLAELLLQSPTNPWIQTGVASSAAEDGEMLLTRLLESDYIDTLSPFLARLTNQLHRRNRDHEIQTAVAALLDAPASPALLPVWQSLRVQQHQSQLDQASFEKASEAVDDLSQQAIGWVADAKRTARERINALRWLAGSSDPDLLSALETLLGEATSADLQQAGITALKTFEDPKVAAMLLDHWKAMSPRLRNTAAEVLFGRQSNTLSVIDAIKASKFSASDIPRSRWETLAASRNETVASFAKQQLESQSDESKDELIARYRSALEIDGDAGHGAVVFKRNCAGCHKIGDQGHALGPSLTAAITRGPESILVNVLAPSREVNPQYLNYVVMSLDGRSYSGMIASENATSIQLKRAESATDTLLRNDIDWIHNTGKSIMPEGLEQSITPEAMADLIAYLQQSL
jgi:putative membrane-bound dehydrogenase-like protein